LHLQRCLVRLDDLGRGHQLEEAPRQRRELTGRLGVCAATVYRLCERGELPHARIVNSIRIRPEDLRAFLERPTGRP